MKRTGRTMTLRGRLPTDASSAFTKKQIIVDDGRSNIGYRVVQWFLFASQPGPNTSFYGNLATGQGTQTEPDASSNIQIGWSQGGYYLPLDNSSLIDPDHIINRELYIRAFNSGHAEGNDINYLVVMEEVQLSNDEAVIAMIKETAQTSPNTT
tara:strand:+ start:720 stop:1178 length:459 start_codon:yes stop_codon:yes gene_type:complete